MASAKPCRPALEQLSPSRVVDRDERVDHLYHHRVEDLRSVSRRLDGKLLESRGWLAFLAPLLLGAPPLCPGRLLTDPHRVGDLLPRVALGTGHIDRVMLDLLEVPLVHARRLEHLHRLEVLSLEKIVPDIPNFFRGHFVSLP